MLSFKSFYAIYMLQNRFIMCGYLPYCKTNIVKDDSLFVENMDFIFWGPTHSLL